MPQSPSMSDLIQLMKAEVSLLHQLHVLSQTESLILEKQDISGLEEVVSRKGAIVQELWTHVNLLDLLLQTQPDLLSGVAFAQKEELESLRGEADHLIKRIKKVDDENLVRLDYIKNKAIEESHVVHQNVALHKAYAPSQSKTKQFFHLAD
jgi:cell division protein FtsB